MRSAICQPPESDSQSWRDGRDSRHSVQEWTRVGMIGCAVRRFSLWSVRASIRPVDLEQGVSGVWQSGSLQLETCNFLISDESNNSPCGQDWQLVPRRVQACCINSRGQRPRPTGPQCTCRELGSVGPSSDSADTVTMLSRWSPSHAVIQVIVSTATRPAATEATTVTVGSKSTSDSWGQLATIVTIR